MDQFIGEIHSFFAGVERIQRHPRLDGFARRCGKQPVYAYVLESTKWLPAIQRKRLSPVETGVWTAGGLALRSTVYALAGTAVRVEALQEPRTGGFMCRMFITDAVDVDAVPTGASPAHWLATRPQPLHTVVFAGAPVPEVREAAGCGDSQTDCGSSPCSSEGSRPVATTLSPVSPGQHVESPFVATVGGSSCTTDPNGASFAVTALFSDAGASQVSATGHSWPPVLLPDGSGTADEAMRAITDLAADTRVDVAAAWNRWPGRLSPERRGAIVTLLDDLVAYLRGSRLSFHTAVVLLDRFIAGVPDGRYTPCNSNIQMIVCAVVLLSCKHTDVVAVPTVADVSSVLQRWSGVAPQAGGVTSWELHILSSVRWRVRNASLPDATALLLLQLDDVWNVATDRSIPAGLHGPPRDAWQQAQAAEQPSRRLASLTDLVADAAVRCTTVALLDLPLTALAVVLLAAALRPPADRTWPGVAPLVALAGAPAPAAVRTALSAVHSALGRVLSDLPDTIVRRYELKPGGANADIVPLPTLEDVSVPVFC